MSILGLIYPKKKQLNYTLIETENGDDWSPVLNQHFDTVRLRERVHTKRHTDIVCAEFGLDIETTTAPAIISHPDGDCSGNAAFMYHWQLTFGEYIITGRVWETLFDILCAIETAYVLGVTTQGRGKKKHTFIRTAICWIANEGYEFQFMCRKKYNGRNILRDGTFSSSMRKPLKAVLGFHNGVDGGITVYDALQFSTSLKQLAKDYCTTQKASGDLDFNIIRNSKTKLNATEKGYCFNDVATLNEWAYFYLEAYVKQERFAPLTSTAIIREALAQEYDRVRTNDLDNKTFSLHPSFGEYHRIIWNLYRGGFTYAHRLNAGKIWHNVVGKDFTSSYPAVMLQEKLPSTPFTPGVANCEADLDKYNGKAWYADFHFKNLIQKQNISVENVMKLHEWNGSAKKCKEVTNCVIDNGKLMYAQECTVTLCEQDWETYKEFYRWDGDVNISNLMVAEKDYLPSFFRKVILHFYKQKSDLKSQGLDDTTEYVLSKSIVNGLYGLTVQKIHFDEVVFTPEEGWNKSRLHYSNEDERNEMAEVYEKELGRDQKSVAARGNLPKVILSPYYGIWITAIARRRLMKAINELGEDFIYCDTDSVYYKNKDKHESYFDDWNKNVYTFNDNNLPGKAFHTLGDFDPVVIKKSDKTTAESYSFKTLGAKRYIKWDGTDIKVTVAGLPHGALERAAKANGADTPEKVRDWAIENFGDGMRIGVEEAAKNAHSYIDYPCTAEVTDNEGNTEIMHEDSSIVIYPIEFTLKIDPEYNSVIGMPIEQIILLKAMTNEEGRFD